MYFRTYGLPKTSSEQCVKSPVSEDPSKDNMLNAPKHCSNLKGTPLYHISRSLGGQLSYKKSLLGICKISKLFPNTLSSDAKYSLLIETI